MLMANLTSDAINQSKELDMVNLKSTYVNLFDEKAQELQNLRVEYEKSLRKIDQQNRSISDLEFKEKELNQLLSKKQACHHREFEKTYSDMQNEIDFLREVSKKSETELMNLVAQFKELQLKAFKQLKLQENNAEKVQENNSEDSGLHNSSSTSQDASIESTEPVRQNAPKKRRGKKKRK